MTDKRTQVDAAPPSRLPSVIYGYYTSKMSQRRICRTWERFGVSKKHPSKAPGGEPKPPNAVSVPFVSPKNTELFDRALVGTQFASFVDNLMEAAELIDGESAFDPGRGNCRR